MPGMDCAAIVLAAGASTRFGQPKQLLPWFGRPLIAHIADTAWMAGLDPVIVVLGAEAERIQPALAARPVQLLRNYRWAEGMSASIATGIAAVPARTSSAVFLPVDQPLVTPGLLQQLVRQHRQTHAEIVVPQAATGQRGTPALFASSLFAELAALRGNVGGRALFDRYRDRLSVLEIDDPLALADVDTPEAYKTLLAMQEERASDFDFSRIRGVICDMDGVLWRGDEALNGLGAFFALLEDRQTRYVLATNNSSRTPEQYVAKLARMGVETDKACVLNSAMAAASFVAQRSPGASVYAIGSYGVMQALEACGLHRIHDGDATRADYVLVGWDQELTWKKLALAARHILEGASFVSTNPDLTFPTEEGLVPGNGAQVAALEAATGVHAVTIGKPGPVLYEQALTRLGTRPEETLVIGDRLDTDILGGIRLGLPTVLLLSGVISREECEASPIRPDLVLDDLSALVKRWRDA